MRSILQAAWPIAIALAAGAALASQVGMNNALRARLGHPVVAALVSFGVGTLALALYLAALRPGLPDRSAFLGGPRWMWFGGLVGAAYVASAAAFAQRLGAGAWLALVIAGQILASVALDHFGLLGFTPHPATIWRVVGVVLLLAGVVLVLRS